MLHIAKEECRLSICVADILCKYSNQNKTKRSTPSTFSTEHNNIVFLIFLDGSFIAELVVKSSWHPLTIWFWMQHF